MCLFVELRAGEQLKAMNAASYTDSPYYTLTRASRTSKHPPAGKEVRSQVNERMSSLCSLFTLLWERVMKVKCCPVMFFGFLFYHLWSVKGEEVEDVSPFTKRVF